MNRLTIESICQLLPPLPLLPIEKLVLVCIASYCAAGRPAVDHQTLSSCTGLSTDRVRKAVGSLQRFGLLHAQVRHGRPNVYMLMLDDYAAQFERPLLALPQRDALPSAVPAC
jgi:hypothetical protein